MSEQPQSNQTPRRVLVVDDNPVMRVILSSLLIQRGFEVIEENSSETALLRLQTETFDCVMLDIMLFNLSGIDLCQIIRQNLGLLDLPVIAYTGHQDELTVARLRKAGFSQFLFKPVDGPALDQVLRELNPGF